MKLLDAIGLYEEVPPQDDPGRMTLQEFLREMNPGRVHHPSHAYDVGIEELNIDYARENVGSLRYGRWKELAFVRTATGFEIVDPENTRVLAVIHEGILYHSPKLDPRHLSGNALTQRGESSPVLFEKARPVKYLHEVIDAVDNTRSRNLEAMPHVLQRVQISGESFEVRTEREPSLHSRQTIRILNDKGQNVAQASDEWGATLVMVAREHRGMGLGKLIAEHWNRWNPRMLSGGFTQAGEATATAMWKSRVPDGARSNHPDLHRLEHHGTTPLELELRHRRMTLEQRHVPRRGHHPIRHIDQVLPWGRAQAHPHRRTEVHRDRPPVLCHDIETPHIEGTAVRHPLFIGAIGNPLGVGIGPRLRKNLVLDHAIRRDEPPLRVIKVTRRELPAVHRFVGSNQVCAIHALPVLHQVLVPCECCRHVALRRLL